MSEKNAHVDQYILKSQLFAKPILEHLRDVVHDACPGVVETIKWGMPHFEYNGKTLCSMASFKNHCAFNFWMAQDMKTYQKLNKNKEGMGHFGKINNIKELPSNKELQSCIKEAMQLLDDGWVLKRNNSDKEKALEVPDYLLKALKANKKAKINFDKASYSWRKEYVDWITDAKTEATRDKRISTALEWMKEGKGRNWKYEK